jgi:hypothetical protein
MHAHLQELPLCLFKHFDWLSFRWAVCPGALACKGADAESILYLCGAQLGQQIFGKIGSIALKQHLYSYLASKELPMAM